MSHAATSESSDDLWSIIKEADSLEISISSHSHEAHYSKISERIRSFSSSNQLAHSFQCAAFCGGTECKHENPAKWDITHGVAFNGLSSHWITDNVLAMARPSTRLFDEYNLIQWFIESGIIAVFNLQTPGEHAQCGPGLEPGGFTYNPETFMKNNIYFYNYPWPDYGAPPVPVILDVVKVIDFSCSSGKVAVHCHAGLGRTGVVIACYLLYSKRLTPVDAITIIREKRHGSIQTRGQLEVIEKFYWYLCSMWRVYPQTVHLTEYLKKQSKLFHGEEEKKYRCVPKVVSLLCNRLKELSSKKAFKFRCTNLSGEKFEVKDDKQKTLQDSHALDCHEEEKHEHFLQSLLLTSDCCHCEPVTTAQKNIEIQINSKWGWPLLEEESDPTVLFILLFNFFGCCQKAVLRLLLDTIKIIVNDYELSSNIELISHHLSSVLIDKESVTKGSDDFISFEKKLQEYLANNLSF